MHHRRLPSCNPKPIVRQSGIKIVLNLQQFFVSSTAFRLSKTEMVCTCMMLVFPTAGAPSMMTLTRSTDSGLTSIGLLRLWPMVWAFGTAFWRFSRKSRSSSETKRIISRSKEIGQGSMTYGDKVRQLLIGHLDFRLNTRHFGRFM